jgi:hypothetical protein
VGFGRQCCCRDREAVSVGDSSDNDCKAVKFTEQVRCVFGVDRYRICTADGCGGPSHVDIGVRDSDVVSAAYEIPRRGSSDDS